LYPVIREREQKLDLPIFAQRSWILLHTSCIDGSRSMEYSNGLNDGTNTMYLFTTLQRTARFLPNPSGGKWRIQETASEILVFPGCWDGPSVRNIGSCNLDLQWYLHRHGTTTTMATLSYAGPLRGILQSGPIKAGFSR